MYGPCAGRHRNEAAGAEVTAFFQKHQAFPLSVGLGSIQPLSPYCNNCREKAIGNITLATVSRRTAAFTVIPDSVSNMSVNKD